MERPNFKSFITQNSDFCEKSSDVPVKTFVPKQSIQISELVRRFESGQRLNVHQNFAPGSNMESISDEEALEHIRQESMDTDDFPPTDVHDVVDVQREMEINEAHKADFKYRQKKKKEEAKQAAESKAKQAPDASPSQE